MTVEEFGQRVKKLRTEAGLSQLEFGLQCDSLSQSFIAAIEKGEKAPTITTLDKIAYGFGLTLSELLEENDRKFEYDSSMNKLIAYASTLTPDERDDMVEVMKLLHRILSR